ncbi:proteinase-activated receptor 3-like [Amblyraja radiata]|uniref:proteinase-activated receptor 3-like n=1 Tax=Amblyraja radiata TaxID=386614 RepID=UPI0014041E23|nr:proteinase-activated receptor 3-like [Amblyraja radiata]
MVRSFPLYKHGNNSFLNDSAKEHLTSSISTVVIPVISSIILIIGLPANGLALWVLATKVQRMPSTIFLMNLATADLLLILALPFKIHYHFQGNNWVFGEALCRTMTAFSYGNMYCSILLLTVISIDRYFALVHPFYSKGFRDNRFAVVTCLTIWFLVGLSTIPFLQQNQLCLLKDLNITTCHDVLPEEMASNYYFVFLMAFGFLIPCLITIFCNVSIIRALVVSAGSFGPAVRNMTLVMIVFVVCFAPSNIILLIHHSESIYYLYHYYMICLMLSTLNNCIDPFIYYYISDEFRSKVRSLTFCVRTNEGSRKSARPLVQTNTSSTPDSKVSSN